MDITIRLCGSVVCVHQRSASPALRTCLACCEESSLHYKWFWMQLYSSEVIGSFSNDILLSFICVVIINAKELQLRKYLGPEAISSSLFNLPATVRRRPSSLVCKSQQVRVCNGAKSVSLDSKGESSSLINHKTA